MDPHFPYPYTTPSAPSSTPSPISDSPPSAWYNSPDQPLAPNMTGPYSAYSSPGFDLPPCDIPMQAIDLGLLPWAPPAPLPLPETMWDATMSQFNYMGAPWGSPYQQANPPEVVTTTATQSSSRQVRRIPPQKGKKTLICDYCSRTFHKTTPWEQHLLTHTGEKPHPCGYCPRSFSVKCNRKRHHATCKVKRRSESGSASHSRGSSASSFLSTDEMFIPYTHPTGTTKPGSPSSQ